MFSMKNHIQLPHTRTEVMNYIKAHHLKENTVAQNITAPDFPHGLNVNWFEKYLKHGIYDDDFRIVKRTVNKLCQLKKKRHERRIKQNKKPRSNARN